MLTQKENTEKYTNISTIKYILSRTLNNLKLVQNNLLILITAFVRPQIKWTCSQNGRNNQNTISVNLVKIKGFILFDPFLENLLCVPPLNLP